MWKRSEGKPTLKNKLSNMGKLKENVKESKREREEKGIFTRNGKNQLLNVVVNSKRMLMGDDSLQEKVLSREFKTSRSDLICFQQSLAHCQEQWNEIQKQQKAYDRAKAVFRSYYAQDNLLDFINILIRFLDKEPREGADPVMYASKGYDNSLVFIRRMFQSMKDSRQEWELHSNTSSDRHGTARVNMLRDVCHDNADIDALVYTLKKADARQKKMEAGQISNEELRRLAEEAEILKSLFTAQKMQGYTEYLEKKSGQLESRVRRINKEIKESEDLYGVLSSVMDSEENNRLMDELNPKSGMLEGKTSEEIREKYQPLLTQLREITERFPAKTE